jgi:hypothetical protein
MISPRLIIYGIVFLAIAGVVWHDHFLAGRLKAVRAEKVNVEIQRDQALKTIQTLKADAKLNQETSHDLAERLAKIERDSRAKPLRLRCSSADLPRPAESGTTAGTPDASAGRIDGSADVPTFDAGPGLSEFQRRCAVNAARQLTLQEWEKRREH